MRKISHCLKGEAALEPVITQRRQATARNKTPLAVMPQVRPCNCPA